MLAMGARRLLSGFFVLAFTGVAFLTPDLRATELDEITKALEKASKELSAIVTKLQKTLAQKDGEISALKKQVEELRAQLAKAEPKPKPEPKPEPKPAAKPSNAFLGISHTDNDGGALVVEVLGGTGAAASGLKSGDVVASVDGKTITSETLEVSLPLLYQPGAKVKLAVLRAGEKLELTAELGDRAKYDEAQAALAKAAAAKAVAAKAAAEKAAAAKAAAGPLLLGITVAEPEGGGIVTVDEVEEGFTGSVIGLAVNDRIVKFNNKEVKVIEDLQVCIKTVKGGDKFELVVQRGDETLLISAIGSVGREGAKLLKSGPVTVAPAAQPAAATQKPGYLGVSVTGLTIDAIVPDSAAAASGLAVNDVIKKVNGTAIKDQEQLGAILGKLHAGDKVTMVVQRGSESHTIEGIVLGVKGEKVGAAANAETKPGKPGYLGVVVYQDEGSPLVVMEIDAGGPGEQSGLKPGDVLVQFAAKPIKSFQDLESAMRSLRAGEEVTVLVSRNDKEVAIKVTLGERPVAG